MDETDAWNVRRFCGWLVAVTNPVFAALLLVGCVATSDEQYTAEDLLERGDQLAHAQYLEANSSMIELHRRGVVYEDEASRELIDQVLQRLFPGKANNPVRVTLARLPGENAYALPSGDIIIHQSMLAALSTEAQLAFVLAHESAHVFLNHAWLSAAHRTKRRAAAHVSDVLMFGNSRSYGYFAGNVEAYGRQQEFEADAYAARILAQAGYDLTGAAEFFNVLNRYPMVYEAQLERTHPGIALRRQRLTDMAAHLQPQNGGNRDSESVTPLLQSAEATDGYNSHRIRLLKRSVKDKIVEHDLPGALVQLDELERLDGKSTVTDCLRGNLYTAIAADVDEAAKALKEIIAPQPVVGEKAAGKKAAGTKAAEQTPVEVKRGFGNRARSFFLKQARGIYNDRLSATPGARCASKGLEKVQNLLARSSEVATEALVKAQ